MIDRIQRLVNYLKAHRAIKYLFCCSMMYIYVLPSGFTWWMALPLYVCLVVFGLTSDQSDNEPLTRTDILLVVVGMLFLTAVLHSILMVVKAIVYELVADSRTILQLIDDLSESVPLFRIISSPIFWYILPVAIVVALVVIFFMYGLKNPKHTDTLITIIRFTEMPLIVLQVYHLWEYFKDTNSLSTTVQDNMLGVIFFMLGLALMAYNSYVWYKKKESSVLYFIFNCIDLYFFIISTIINFYFHYFRIP